MEKAKLSEYTSAELAGLFDGEAKVIANSFIDKNGKYSVTHSQMRRFYNEVKSLDRKLDGRNDAAWEEIQPYIALINSKVSYNVARAIDKNPSEGDVYKNLSAFIKKYIDKAKDEKSYHIFSTLFEAVYGFYYKETVERNIKGDQ